ncbi:MAG: sensor histidine kinase [Parvibaculaceae bacterium]
MSETDQTTTKAVEASAERTAPVRWRGLSAKVLVLTILFVMIGEVLIFLPSIANYRIMWLKGRIATAEIAALAAEAAPAQQLAPDLEQELLKGAGVKVVALKRGPTRHLMLRTPEDILLSESYDLRETRPLGSILDALKVLAMGGGRIIGVTDLPPNMSGDLIDIALDETALRQAMLRFSGNILTLSVILSLIVAALVFLTLNQVLVRPIRRLIRNILRFREDPEDHARVIEPSGRRDELGVAEAELAGMQTDLADMLQQKSRLAALGLAVSKVSHDLRNMLASAQLLSDRLSQVDDPTVQKLAPKLVSSIDRAINLCVQTLKFGRVQEAPPLRERFALRPLVEEVLEPMLMQASDRTVIYNDVAQDSRIDADREQLFRVLTNLVRNAVEAIEQALKDGLVRDEGHVRIRAFREGSVTTVEVRDNGPGVPARVREHLFEAFRGSGRSGGIGLGLSIAQELAHAHGGELRLITDLGEGATFWVEIPDRVSELRPGRRGFRSGR